MEKREKKLVKNTAILGLGALCTKGIMFLMTPLFTRWLTQSDYGIFDLIITYVTLIIPIITLSCNEALFRFLLEKNTFDEDKKIVTNTILVHLIGFLISFVAIIIISIIFSDIRNLLFYFLILLILEALNTFMMMMIRGIKKLDIYTVANILFVIFMAISVTVFVKILDFGLEGILLGYCVGYLVSILFMAMKSNVLRYLSLKSLDKKVTKKMLKYSLPLIPNALSWWVVNVSDRTIVSVILGTSSNAILAVANKIPNLCQTFFNVFNLSWQESATETIDDEDKENYYNGIMNQMLKILGSVCVVILSCNFLIFEILFDKSYFSAYYQVPILVLAIILSMLAQFLGGIYIARKESSKNGKTTLLAAFINVIVHLLFIRFIGIYAATISTLISYLVLFIVRYIDIKKDLNLKFNSDAIRVVFVFLYFFITSYINNFYLNIINLLLAFIYFVYVNKEVILSILKKLKK